MESIFASPTEPVEASCVPVVAMKRTVERAPTGIPKTLPELEALADKGFEYVNSSDYEHALIIAAQLKKSRYTACFEIAALAHAGMEQKEKAVAVLEEGTSVAPDLWINWELLGNYLSDLGRYKEFEVIAEDALQAVDFIITHEDDPRIRKARVLETTQGSPAPEEALGICSRTPCIFYIK